MRNALIVSYLSPPAGGVGVMRALKFVKYLPLYGWRPIVLTSRDPGETIDHSLLAEVSPQTEVHYAWSLHRMSTEAMLPTTGSERPPEASTWSRPSSRTGLKKSLHAVFMDRSVAWAPHAVLKGLHTIRRNDVKVIFATGGPWWTHIVGWWLRRITRRPLVIDFRDQWALGPSYGWGYPFEPFLNRAWERLAVTGADKVTVALPGLVTDFLERYPKCDPHKFSLVTNGFDDEDTELGEVRGQSRATGPGFSRADDTFLVMHTGSIRAQTSPRNFLAAVRSLLDHGLMDPRKIRIQFAGRVDKESSGKGLSDYVRLFNLDGMVERLGYLPHKQVTQLQRQANALLQFHLPAPFKGASLPQKVFEYMAARRPILALAPNDSSVAEYLARTGTGISADPDDVDDIATKLKLLYDTKGEFLIRDEHEIGKYSRRSLTQELAGIFDSLTD